MSDNLLNNIEIDAVGEILNISMGSAATAISKMLDKEVHITTPEVFIESAGRIDYSKLEPAIAVKITYTEGIDGSNVIILKQSDMQIILSYLMGQEPEPNNDFVFDELSISAACEVMNQMMGASATTLSEFLNRTVNISTPQATVLDSSFNFAEVAGLKSEDNIVGVKFKLDIKDVMESEFVSVLPIHLAREIISQFGIVDGKIQNEQANEAPLPPTPPVQQPVMGAQNAYANIVAQQDPNATKNVIKEPVDVEYAQFGQFPLTEPLENPAFSNNNMNLIMNVPLDVTVEIGKTSRKIKDILDFTQGTVIELDKQAGAPIDVIVNGQLIARGDVVVIDDNFGVRITEILDAKNLLNSIK